LRITEIEVDNFKSFGRKVKIPFFEGFTVISGPNGSGKSNIIDSILFVLSLSSARGLRAERLTDLINVNTGRNTAEVTITFSDGTSIRRRIKKTANGYYSYHYMNDRVCRQGDVIEFLARHGIKPEGYNVVMQGDITRIMDMNNSERRKIIDEIAGVAEFDNKREKALSELEVVRERIEREELLLHELHLRLDELKGEREQALLYRKRQEEVAQLQEWRDAARLRDKEGELKTLDGLFSGHQASLSRLLSDRVAKEDDLEKTRDELSALDEEINTKSGVEYLGMISLLEEEKSAVKVAERTIERLKADKVENQESINRIYLDIRRVEERIGELTESIRNLTVDRSNLSMERALAKTRLDKVSEQIEQGSREVEGAKEDFFRLMGDLEEKKTLRSGLLHQQDILIEKSRLRTSERQRLEGRIRQIEEECGEKTRHLDEYRACIDGCAKTKGTLDSVISETERSLFAAKSSLEHLNGEIRQVEQEIMRLEAQQQARGGVGGCALEAILGMDGVCGTIARLGRAPPEYATALDVAAGGRLNYVVVETDTVAADAIAYLKEHRLGRLTFLPLNRLKPPSLPALRDKSLIGYAISLLEFDPRFDEAFRLVFGATVVVDTLDRARGMMGRYRMVTLDGELLERSGAMSGGSRQKRTHGFGVAADEDLSRLRLKMADLMGDAAELSRTIERLTADAEEKRTERRVIDEQVSRYQALGEDFRGRVDALLSEKEELEHSLQEMDGDVRSAGEDLARLEGEIEALSSEISDINGAVETLRKQLDGTEIPALTKDLERHRQELGEIEKRLQNKDADILDAQRQRQHFTNRLGELKAERERFEEKTQGLDDEVAALEGQITESKVQISDIEARQQEFSEDISDLRKERDLIMERVHGMERDLLGFDEASEGIRLQISALEVRKTALMEEIESLRDLAGDADTELSLEEIDERLEAAEKALRRIGAVNMLAIEEHERVMARIEEKTGRKETLSRERTVLIERIEKFGQMKYDAFMTAFDAINANFREIFANLTSGSGRLILENEDDPFSGGMKFAVQPRDKNVPLVSSLSGGEKSITTLAFIFAIQTYIPAPFYALDEVDMFLDGSNVVRVASMIKDLSTNAQSIIVSLRKPMIERADRIVGVTLRPDMSTYVTGVKNNDG